MPRPLAHIKIKVIASFSVQLEEYNKGGTDKTQEAACDYIRFMKWETNRVLSLQARRRIAEYICHCQSSLQLHPDRALLDGRRRSICAIADILGTCHDRGNERPHETHIRPYCRTLPSDLDRRETTPCSSNANKLACHIPHLLSNTLQMFSRFGTVALSTHSISFCQARA